MQKNEEIFINNEHENENNQPQQISYIHNTQSDQFISQFLFDQASHDFSKQKHESAPLILQRIKQISPQLQLKPQNHKKKSKRQKSLFHNFQKHLVISLKKIVRIKTKPDDDLIPKIAQQMWEIFLKSHLYTKTILHILYGAQQEEQECSFTSSMLNKFGYVDLFNKYSQDLVKQAQRYLRQETVKAVKKVNIKQYLSKRRLGKSQDFQDYLNQFVQQLLQGPIKKRIPKIKKQNLKAYQKNHKVDPNKHEVNNHNNGHNGHIDQNNHKINNNLHQKQTQMKNQDNQEHNEYKQQFF